MLLLVLVLLLQLLLLVLLLLLLVLARPHAEPEAAGPCCSARLRAAACSADAPARSCCCNILDELCPVLLLVTPTASFLLSTCTALQLPTERWLCRTQIWEVASVDPD